MNNYAFSREHVLPKPARRDHRDSLVQYAGKSMRAKILLAAVVVWLLSIPLCAAQDQDISARLAAAKSRLAAIQRRITHVRDIDDIEKLQRIYGYYLDKMLWDQVVDLFADNATLEIGVSGVYIGKDSIRKYLYSLSDGRQGPIQGRLYEHMQFQPIITLSNDGRTARGRWHSLLQLGVYGSGSGGQWGEGTYENEYVKQDGVWKISKLHWYAEFIAPYEGGWLKVNKDAVKDYSVGKGVTPDRPPSEDYKSYPDVYIVPFHYPNPVTGKPWKGK